MPLLNEVRAIVSQMTSNNGAAPSFLYGTEKELNIKAEDVVMPCVFMYALQPFTLSRGITAAVNDKYSILLYFLDKTDFGEFTSDCEAVVNEQIKAAKEFILRMEDYRPDGVKKYFKTSAKDTYRGQQVFNKFDFNGTGIAIPMDVKTMYADLMCV